MYVTSTIDTVGLKTQFRRRSTQPISNYWYKTRNSQMTDLDRMVRATSLVRL